MLAINQSEPLQDYNLYVDDPALRDCINAFQGELNPTQKLNLVQFGAAIGSADYLNMASEANRDSPRLHSYDSRGNRLDQVVFHPTYHALMHHCVQEGLHASPWFESSPTNSAHLIRGTKFLMHSGVEPGVLCPISMTYAVVPALHSLDSNTPWVKELMLKLKSKQYDARPIAWQSKAGMTMGMGMTEKQGGSDVRANVSVAKTHKDGSWRIDGHKWFFSAPMSDAFLVLAQTKAGLSCFFVPSYLPQQAIAGNQTDRNAINIARLKNKLGNHSNASSEVEFNQAQAWLVGEAGRGIQTILEMGTVTRIDCALGTAGLMRRAVALAIDHCAQRKAFGQHLVKQPLMLNTLADMALESEAACALALRLAHTLDHPSNPHEQALRRLLTPAAKYWICKRGSGLAQEAMECLGGNGYVEDSSMARIYREMPLNSIWEGAGNIMAIDLLRGFGHAGCIAALQTEVAPTLSSTPRAGLFAQRLFNDLEYRPKDDQVLGRGLAMRVALLMQAHLLGYNPILQQAFCQTRMTPEADPCPPAVFGTQAIPEADLIVRRAAPRALPSLAAP